MKSFNTFAGILALPDGVLMILPQNYEDLKDFKSIWISLDEF